MEITPDKVVLVIPLAKGIRAEVVFSKQPSVVHYQRLIKFLNLYATNLRQDEDEGA